MLQAYERVVALGNISPTFALLQSGIILQSLASYTQVCTIRSCYAGLCSKVISLCLNLLKQAMLRLCDGSCLQAIDMFRNALDKAPGHVVAQCGLASALLGRARQCAGVGALAWAATLLQVLLCTVFRWVVYKFLLRYFSLLMTIIVTSRLSYSLVLHDCSLQEAADVAQQCTANDGTVAAGWKLLGDIEVYITYSGSKHCRNYRILTSVATTNRTESRTRVMVEPVRIIHYFMPSVFHACCFR